MLPPRGVSTAHRIQTKFGRAGDLPNVTLNVKSVDINCDFGDGWSFMF